MQPCHTINNVLHIENISLENIAKQFGTPCYVYSRAAIETNLAQFQKAFQHRPHRICYAVKANSNLAILNIFAEHNIGFDIVSGGELERVLAAGGDPNKIIFSGVGKTKNEIVKALNIGIHCFNVESEPELFRLNEIAKENNTTIKIGLRINPDVDAKTHPHIATGLSENKFGLDWQHTLRIVDELPQLKHLKLIGIGCHIGSQLTSLEPFSAAIDRILFFIEKLKDKNIYLDHIDLGGGLGVVYHNETPPSVTEYAKMICNKLSSFEGDIIFEPGRSLVANTGVLLTTIEYIKQTAHKNFAIVDAGMNDLLRPPLYEAWHQISPVKNHSDIEATHYDIVGPVCESADILGKNRLLSIQQNDILAIHSVGAYGFSMSSNYNSRARPVEIMIDDNQVFVIRERETLQDLFSTEKLLSKKK
ncbi:MAG: diaminopimelate decarboxylase [Gammaproteobacteria bacterium]|nr:diaminopimelate decarboxylase [Gammaproteobacteria bacterium]